MKRLNLNRVATVAALTAVLGVSSACTAGYVETRHARVYVAVAPPAPVYETRIVSPGPGYVWVPGFYEWTGRAYVWRRGEWERPPRARAHWVPAHWQHDRHGYYFVQGHWR